MFIKHDYSNDYYDYYNNIISMRDNMTIHSRNTDILLISQSGLAHHVPLDSELGTKSPTV